MSREDQLEKTKKHLRSVLISEKGGVALDRLERDYKELVGQSLPYKAFGFTKVAALLESIPDVCSLQQRGGALMVVGVASRDTAHVLNMVNRQGKKQGRGGGEVKGSSRGGDWKSPASGGGGRSGQTIGIGRENYGGHGERGPGGRGGQSEALHGQGRGRTGHLGGGPGQQQKERSGRDLRGSSDMELRRGSGAGSGVPQHQPVGERLRRGGAAPDHKLDPGFTERKLPPRASKFSGNGFQDIINEQKRQVLQLCKGGVTNPFPKGAETPTVRNAVPFVAGGNLSSVPSPSDHSTAPTVKSLEQGGKVSHNQTKQAQVNSIPDLSKALQAAVKKGSPVHVQAIDLMSSAQMSESVTSAVTWQKNFQQLEVRMKFLEQQFSEEKAAKEKLLVALEKVLEGKTPERKLVRLVHEFSRIKFCGHEKGGPLDVNGNEAPVSEMDGTNFKMSNNTRPGKVSNMAKPNSNTNESAGHLKASTPPFAPSRLPFMPRVLALGGGRNNYRGNTGGVGKQVLGPNAKEVRVTNGGSSNLMMSESSGLSQDSVQSMNCHLRSPEGRMLA